MNKKMFIFFLVVLLMISTGNIFAQNDAIENDRGDHLEKKPQRPLKPYFLAETEVFKKEVEALLIAEKEIVNAVEKRYDANGDGKFQEKELKAFWSDVIFTIERRGWIKINSTFLEVFDIDKDGRINLSESFEIKRFLRQENL